MHKLPLFSFLISPFFTVTAKVGESSLTMSMRKVVKSRKSFIIKYLKSSDILMKRAVLPPAIKGEAFEEALAFKAEEELPFTAEEGLFVIPKPPDGLFFATKRDKLPEGPYDAIAAVPQALAHFTSYFSLPEQFLLIYSDDEETTFLLMDTGSPTLCRVVKKEVTYEKEIARCCKAHGFGPEIPVLMLGQKIEGFTNLLELTPRFGMNAEELREKALLVGLARLPFALPLQRFDFSKKQVSFKRIPIFKALIISALSCATLFLASEQWLSLQKNALAQSKGVSDIQEYIESTQKRLSLSRYPYPLKPQTPAFSDFLAWISTKAPAGLQINKIHYSLVSMPTIKSPKERYVVQVELSFVVDKPQTARLFHEQLTAQNAFVVQDAHFVWQSSNSGYRAVFRLKDRTFYELS